MNDKIQQLYNALEGDYDLGSIEDFTAYLQDESKRKMFYEQVIAPQYNVESLQQFESVYGLGVKKKDSIPLEERVDVTESVTEEAPVEDTLSALQSPEQFQFGEQVEETPIPLRPEDTAPEEAAIQPTEIDPETFVLPEEPLVPGESALDIETRKNQADAIFNRLNRQKAIKDELIKQKVEKGEIDESDIDLESVVQEKFPELKDQVKRELSAQDDWIRKFGTLEGYETEEDFFEGAFGSALKTFDDVTYIGLGEFVDDLGRAVMSGRAQGNVAEATNELLLKGSMASNEQIDKFIEAQKQAGEYQMSAEMRQYIKTSEEEGGFLGMIFGLAENPTILLEVAATSFASMAANKESLDAAANVLEAGMAYGAGTGMTAGTAVGGVGALPGAAVGTVTGFASAIPFAFGAASTVLEAGSKFSELLMEEVGDKPLNRENIRNMLNDKEAYKKIRNKAITRGLTVGIIDTAFGLIGGSVGAKMLTKGAGKGKVLAVTTGFEGTGGATGEALGTVAIGETPTWSDVGLEFFAETPGSAKTFIQSQIKATDPATYKINGNTVNESVIKDVVESMSPEELAESNITIENDKDLSDKVQNKIVKGAVKEQISQAKPELNDATVDKIADLQMEADKLKDNKTQAGKRKVAELNEQMKELEDNPIEAAPEVKIEEKVTEEAAPDLKIQEERKNKIKTEETSAYEDIEKSINEGLEVAEKLSKSENPEIAESNKKDIKDIKDNKEDITSQDIIDTITSDEFIDEYGDWQKAKEQYDNLPTNEKTKENRLKILSENNVTVMTDKNMMPRVMFHGTKASREQLKDGLSGGTYISESMSFSQGYGRVLKGFVKVGKITDGLKNKTEFDEGSNYIELGGSGIIKDGSQFKEIKKPLKTEVKVGEKVEPKVETTEEARDLDEKAQEDIATKLFEEEVSPEVEVTEEVAPEPKEVRYEMNKTDKKIWRKDFEIVDNRDGKELGPPKENGKWVVVNKVTGQVVIATSKRDAQSIIDNAPADPGLFGEGQIVDADQIITPETGIEITEEAAPEVEVTEEESSLLSEIEDIDGQIESKQEEISIEQGDEKQEIARIDAEIKEVRASKIDRESKAERIDELKAEKSDYKDSQKSIIQDFKDDIKELKKEKRKAERKLKKISEKKPAVKVKPKENKPKVVRKPKKEKAKKPRSEKQKANDKRLGEAAKARAAAKKK